MPSSGLFVGADRIPVYEEGLGVRIRRAIPAVDTCMKLYRYLPALVLALGLLALLSACGGKGGGGY